MTKGQAFLRFLIHKPFLFLYTLYRVISKLYQQDYCHNDNETRSIFGNKVTTPNKLAKKCIINNLIYSE